MWLKMTVRLFLGRANQRALSTTASASTRLNYEVFKSDQKQTLAPVVIAHGMLGSLANWTSIAKNLRGRTGRTVVTFDARNHGNSEHTDTMTYEDMTDDIIRLVESELNFKVPVILMGHSMGGRTAMNTALSHPDWVDQLVVVDVSPVNRDFQVEDSTSWNMSHFFHMLKSVQFPDPQQFPQISDGRRQLDQQLAHRIKDPGIRAWLLMNLQQDSLTKAYGWRCNVNAIHAAFSAHITRFPYDQFHSSGTTFAKKTIFIGGADSDYIPVHDQPAILELFPLSQFVYIEGAGHWVHAQKPHEFIQAVTDFLKW